LIVTSLAPATQPRKNAKQRMKQIEMRQRKAGAAPSNTGGVESTADSQISTVSVSQSTITFSNTAAYGRMIGSGPDRFSKKADEEEDPQRPKYARGYGSVKGLHYRKYIGLEMLSENNFALTFHKFYSNEIKNLIRSMQNSRFSPEMRTWVLSILNYDQLMAELKQICVVNQIHIEDIPQFTMNLMKTKVPYALASERPLSPDRKRYEYGTDKTTNLKLEEFLPPHIFKNLLAFQRDGVKRGLKMHGRILINDDFGTGKSLQALSLALAYRMEWPLLIVCPAFLKFNWRQEILKWLPGFDIDRIQVMANEREDF